MFGHWSRASLTAALRCVRAKGIAQGFAKDAGFTGKLRERHSERLHLNLARMHLRIVIVADGIAWIASLWILIRSIPAIMIFFGLTPTAAATMTTPLVGCRGQRSSLNSRETRS